MTTLCFCAFRSATLLGTSLVEADAGLLNTRTILARNEAFSQDTCSSSNCFFRHFPGSSSAWIAITKKPNDSQLNAEKYGKYYLLDQEQKNKKKSQNQIQRQITTQLANHFYKGRVRPLAPEPLLGMWLDKKLATKSARPTIGF